MTTTPPAATVTAVIDDFPCPRVEVLVTPMPVDAVAITVWRNYDGRRSIVAGGSAAPVAGDFFLVDYWVPLGAPVSYTTQTVDAGGTPSQISVASDQVIVETTDVWLSDPLDPASSFPVALESNSDRSAELRGSSFRQAPENLNAALSPVFGQAEPYGAADLRQAASGVPLEIATFDLNTFASLRDLLRQAYPLCVRTPSTVPLLPGLAYLSIPTFTPTLMNDNVTVVWTMTGDVIAPPGASVLLPVRVLDDITDEATSLDGLLALYDTLIDVQRGG